MTTPTELRELLAKATPGPWEVDSEYDDDAVYSGGGGCGRGFKNFFIGADIRGKWATLFDSVNSDEKLIHEEFDEDGKYSWDEVGRANAALIVAAVNALPSLLDRIEALEAFQQQAVKHVGELAREAGEAKGKLEASELPGILDGWRDKCTQLKAELTTAHEVIADQLAIRQRLEADISRTLGIGTEYVPGCWYWYSDQWSDVIEHDGSATMPADLDASEPVLIAYNPREHQSAETWGLALKRGAAADQRDWECVTAYRRARAALENRHE